MNALQLPSWQGSGGAERADGRVGVGVGDAAGSTVAAGIGAGNGIRVGGSGSFGGDEQRQLGVVDAWAGSSAIRALVSAFGQVMPILPADLRLQWLENFASAHWNFRRGNERNLIGPSGLTTAQTDVVLGAAHELGLAGRHTPSRRRYDTVIMTGGMVRACIVKPRFVAELIESGLECEHILFLGGFRGFAGEEWRSRQTSGWRLTTSSAACWPD